MESGASRIASLDLLRGAVMLLMAIDHVRVYSGLPPGGPTPGIFFTRWVTHFCAPVFVFLAGTGSYLYGRKLAGGRTALARFLLTRGAWLILLELTVIRAAWTFNLRFDENALAGVIWVIGVSMIVLAALVFLPLGPIAAAGLGTIALHNAVDPAGLGSSWAARVLYLGGPIEVPVGDGLTVFVLYSIVPWAGVMAVGYAFGRIMVRPAEDRHRLCIAIGMAAILAFLVLRSWNLYGDPRSWAGAPAPGAPSMPSLLAFLDTTKYPASLLFLLMTLGPAILVLPPLARARGPAARVVEVFGRVPLFYYLLHIPLIHLLALGVSVVRSGQIDAWLLLDHPVLVPPAPPGYVWSLGLVYVATGIAVGILYVPCRWFAGIKARHRGRWLSLL